METETPEAPEIEELPEAPPLEDPGDPLPGQLGEPETEEVRFSG